ncbi:sensor histidine kinase [Amphibacillus sediminis]|uniref:sensor histidine kinase n=1 Tax=Amphibacillus sediminis TaxID=360185 RepID=UPI00083728AB|nr:histidine kinase [Amphibacillus sediminis]
MAFWFSLTYILITWFTGLYLLNDRVPDQAVIILISAVFFTCYFILPLTKRNLLSYLLIQVVLSTLVMVLFGSGDDSGFKLLLLLLLMIQAIQHLKGLKLLILVLFQYGAAVLLAWYHQDYHQVIYISLFVVVMVFIFKQWFQSRSLLTTIQQEKDKLSQEHRRLKRQVVANEKLVRQEERNQIAREIHDSVGHRLTALLMQLEVARLQTEEAELKAKFDQFKQLAQMSLNETREAVKTLKYEETTGLSAIMQLVRKLEAESHIRVAFVVQPGALSLTLTNDQSVAVYRSIQEALTNMMRHSEARRARIEFSLVGDRYFQFQISNPVKKNKTINEGFGLTAMRERLEQLGGSLTISQVQLEFRINGMFPLERGVS